MSRRDKEVRRLGADGLVFRERQLDRLAASFLTALAHELEGRVAVEVDDAPGWAQRVCCARRLEACRSSRQSQGPGLQV
jgi:hypothetical protein